MKKSFNGIGRLFYTAVVEVLTRVIMEIFTAVYTNAMKDPDLTDEQMQAMIAPELEEVQEIINKAQEGFNTGMEFGASIEDTDELSVELRFEPKYINIEVESEVHKAYVTAVSKSSSRIDIKELKKFFAESVDVYMNSDEDAKEGYEELMELLPKQYQRSMFWMNTVIEIFNRANAAQAEIDG